MLMLEGIKRRLLFYDKDYMNSILVSINKILLENAIIFYVLSVVAFVLQW